MVRKPLCTCLSDSERQRLPSPLKPVPETDFFEKAGVTNQYLTHTDTHRHTHTGKT